eukprot:13373916-Heterocapsa_arctica.AAC.1
MLSGTGPSPSGLRSEAALLAAAEVLYLMALLSQSAELSQSILERPTSAPVRNTAWCNTAMATLAAGPA